MTIIFQHFSCGSTYLFKILKLYNVKASKLFRLCLPIFPNYSVNSPPALTVPSCPNSLWRQDSKSLQHITAAQNASKPRQYQ